MFAALGLLLVPILAGTLLTWLYDRDAPLAARLCSGACTGLALFGSLGCVLALLLGRQSAPLILTEVALASPLILLARPSNRARARQEVLREARVVWQAILRPTPDTLSCAIFYGAVSLLLLLLFRQVLFERPDGLYTGLVNNIGDLPFHLQVVASFAHARNLPPEDPTYAGQRFTYPFLADFVTAMLLYGGASLRGALLVQGALLAVAFVGALHRWTWELSRDRLAGLLAPLLALFSGGFGWLLLLGDLRESEHGIVTLLRRLPHDYTILSGTEWRWGNSLTALLMPQRSFLFGLPVAICIFTQWWLAFNEKARAGECRSDQFQLFRYRRMIAAGVLSGLLPLIHTYSFAVVMILAGCLALLFRRWREWLAFFSAALLVCAPEAWWLIRSGAGQAPSFLAWNTGWEKGQNNVVWFWFKNTGIFIPLLGVAAVWCSQEGAHFRRWLLFYLPFTGCFVVPNLVRLAPWTWDNIKVLFYWYIASAPLVAWLLSKLWQQKGKWRLLSMGPLVVLTLAGGLDVWRVISETTQYREFDRQGIAMARQIVQLTSPRSIILHAPTYNSPVFLTGRRSILGHPGWAWSRGLDYTTREEAIRRIYAGGPDAQLLIDRYRVDYVLIGPQENAFTAVKETYFSQYPKLAESGEYRLYKTIRP